MSYVCDLFAWVYIYIYIHMRELELISSEGHLYSLHKIFDFREISGWAQSFHTYIYNTNSHQSPAA